MYKEVINFLELNGFKKSTTPKGNIILSNESCTVHQSIDEQYIITNNQGDKFFSNDLNIYWLIGCLTYNGYMDKNYNKIVDKKEFKSYNITYQKALDIVRDELEPFVDNDDLLYNDEPIYIYLTDDLYMSNIDKYELSDHLDKYLSSTISMKEIESWDTIDDVVKYVMKNFK
jgi:acyl carrier protein